MQAGEPDINAQTTHIGHKFKSGARLI